MGRSVFVPVSRADAVALRSAGWSEPRGGFAATPTLMLAHGYDPLSLEDAEFAALTYAGVAAALAGDEPLRLVLALDLAPDRLTQQSDEPYGAVEVDRVGWSDVTALFADEPAAAPAVRAVREAAAGTDLARALPLPAVDALIDEHDLLWYAPQELDALP